MKQYIAYNPATGYALARADTIGDTLAKARRAFGQMRFVVKGPVAIEQAEDALTRHDGRGLSRMSRAKHLPIVVVA